MIYRIGFLIFALSFFVNACKPREDDNNSKGLYYNETKLSRTPSTNPKSRFDFGTLKRTHTTTLIYPAYVIDTRNDSINQNMAQANADDPDIVFACFYTLTVPQESYADETHFFNATPTTEFGVDSSKFIDGIYDKSIQFIRDLDVFHAKYSDSNNALNYEASKEFLYKHAYIQVVEEVSRALKILMGDERILMLTVDKVILAIERMKLVSKKNNEFKARAKNLEQAFYHKGIELEVVGDPTHRIEHKELPQFKKLHTATYLDEVYQEEMLDILDLAKSFEIKGGMKCPEHHPLGRDYKKYKKMLDDAKPKSLR